MLRLIHSGTRSFLIPSQVFFNYISGITLNYLIILHFHYYPYVVLIILIGGAIFCSTMLVTLFPASSNIHTFSLNFIRIWRNHTKSKFNIIFNPPKKKYNLAFIRSCYPISLSVGNFIVFSKSTNYKWVLFMVYQTMRALLLFGKK